MRWVTGVLTSVVVFVALTGAAQAGTSVLRNGAPGEYEVVDQTNSDNNYRAVTDRASGQWVIYDEKGTISTSGTVCIGVGATVRCPKATWLKFTAGAGVDNIQVAVHAVSTPQIDASPFDGRVKAYGGAGDDILYGGNQDDELYGGNDNDTLDGQAGADRMLGESGNKDVCCYSDRINDVSLKIDAVANDGSAGTDRGQDYVDSSNEILQAGQGNDTLDTSKAIVESGASCTNNPRYKLEGGPGIDTMVGNFCSGDDFDGGDDYDQVSYPGRSVGVEVDQDGNADDGRPGEGDNVRPTIEGLIGSDKDDKLEGADRFPDPGETQATLSGSGGNDHIIPGLRAEALWADGFTASPGTKDELDYSQRLTPVNVSLNKTADDGTSQPAGREEHDDIKTEAVDGAGYGFDIYSLGQNDDTYYGAYADDIPSFPLAQALTANKQVDVYGGPGADKLFSGTNAETLSGGDGKGFSWLNSDQDLASYLFRKPRDAGLTRVAISLDGKANDGETLDAVGTQLLIGSLVAPVISMAKTVRPTNVEAIEHIKFVNPTETTVVVAGPARNTSFVLRGWEAVQYLVTVADELAARFGRHDTVVQKLDKLADEMNHVLRAGEDPIPPLDGGLMLPAAFLIGGYLGEHDNVRDDVEILQGASNNGLTVVPLDYIAGNDKPNTVIGSPGPDMVDGKGGKDVLIGDLSADPFTNQDADRLFGGADNDWLFGGAGPDVLAGGPGQDAIFATDSRTRSDGWRDQIYCGNPKPDAWESVLGDEGQYEGDVFSADEAGDGDIVSNVCKTKSTTSSIKKEGSTLHIASDPGQQNKVRVSSSGTQITVADPAGAFDVDPGSGCSANATQVTCPGSGIARVQIDTGDLKDSVDVTKLSGIPTTVNTDEGNDKVTGSPGADTINTGPGKDKIKAKDGNDTLDGGTQADVLDGGNGSDTISYATRNAPVDVYLAQPSTKHNGTTSLSLNNFPTHGAGDLEGDTIKWAENAIGGSGADIVQGNQLDNRLEGNAGDDALSGGPGNDALLPGNGNDHVLAGDGNDSVKAKDFTVDLRVDCGPGSDTGDADKASPTIDPLIGCEF